MLEAMILLSLAGVRKAETDTAGLAWVARRAP
jgi:hypothetical protein